MHTQCSPQQFVLQGLIDIPLVAKFDGGAITSDAGSVLLAQADEVGDYLRGFAGCFRDGRAQSYVGHSLNALISQRVLGICLGYEDITDHDRLRFDPMFRTVCRRLDADLTEDWEKPLAGKSTLNRLECGGMGLGRNKRYHKIEWDEEGVADFFVQAFLDAHKRPPRRIVLDLDATDDPLHGHQEGRFFHGYYDCYCYMPLYIFCGEHLLCAKLRRSNIDASAGSREELARIVALIRSRWPKVGMIVRGDSGFCREEIMSWCEANGVDYVFGMARNARLQHRLGKAMRKAKSRAARRGGPQRVYIQFGYRTRSSWSRRRRVVGKAEYLPGKENPRFVVTSLSPEEVFPHELYESQYCPRGDMENRIKEQQLYLFADRTSAATMRVNQLRLWFSAAAYVLLSTLRRIGLAGTELATAQCHTIREKLLKLGARITRSTRRVVVSIASGYPYQEIFCRASEALAGG